MGHGGSKTSVSFTSTTNELTGTPLIKLISANMKSKRKWLASVSLGAQTFCTVSSEQTKTPTWNSEKKILLDRDGPNIARISVFETAVRRKNNFVGYCEIDLFKFLVRENLEEFDLLDPSSSDVVGNISVSCSVEDPIETEKSFVRRVLSMVDYDKDGTLSFSEFSDLINAFGNELAADKKEELFKAADVNGNGVVCLDQMATIIITQQQKEPLINCCPVCGEILDVSNNLNNIIHLTLCFDEGTGYQIMEGGFVTEQVADGWMFKLNEWSHFSSYECCLKSGLKDTYIAVFDRKKKKLVQEIIDGKALLALRFLYKSRIGQGLIAIGVKSLLQTTSEMQGRKMDSVESAADIPKFIESFKDQINVDEAKYPLQHFKTLNEFFTRELKPGVRPIACRENDAVAVCAADCRLMAFKTVEESLRVWIKGRKFSIQGLLGNEVRSDSFIGGTLVIFRLAPQDYHRFHSPVTGTIERIINIPGYLYSVNPLAVNCNYSSVFTDNTRVVFIILTEDFGKVAFVAIGATMVGSITFPKKERDHLQKGDELGYFSFGGSTVICVFEKDTIQIDNDLLTNSAKTLETLVTYGMTLGISRRKRPNL